MQIKPQSSDCFSTAKYESSGQIGWRRLPQELLRARTLVAILSLLLAVFASQASALAQEPPMPPLAQDDWDGTMYNEEVFIDATMNDYGMGAPLDLSTVQITMQPFFGTVTVDSVTGVIAYVPDGDYAGQDWFQYSVKDTNGQESNSAFVTIELINIPPMITDFQAYPSPTGEWTFAGSVWDENPGVMTVTLSGLIDVDVEVEEAGYFSVTVTLGPNDFGTVIANTEDEVGVASNIALTTAGNYE